MYLFTIDYYYFITAQIYVMCTLYIASLQSVIIDNCNVYNGVCRILSSQSFIALTIAKIYLSNWDVAYLVCFFSLSLSCYMHLVHRLYYSQSDRTSDLVIFLCADSYNFSFPLKAHSSNITITVGIIQF